MSKNISYDKCEVYSMLNRTSNGLGNFGGVRDKISCTKWVYDTSVMKRTLVSDLDLVCDSKTVRSHANMISFFGKMASAALQGSLSDRFGRRTTLIVSVLGMLGTSFGSAFTYDRISLLIARFFTGFFVTACYLAVFVLGTEYLSMHQRLLFALYIRFVSGAIDCTASLLAYIFRDWQLYQFSICWPIIICTMMCWFIPESPRWLLSKNQFAKAEKSIQMIAKINGKTVPKGLVEKMASGNILKKQQQQSVLHLFTDIKLTVRWIILYINWLALCMNTFGLSFNISNMKGNIFVNFAVGGVLDMAMCMIVSFVVNRVSRRYLFVFLMVFSACSCISTFIPILLDAPDTFIIGLSLLGKGAASACVPVLYTFSAELYPTPFRGSGVGSCSMISRVGGLVSPYIADLNLYASGKMADVLPQLVFGSCAIAGGLTALTHPETQGRELPETIDDIKAYSRKLAKPVDKSEVTSV